MSGSVASGDDGEIDVAVLVVTANFAGHVVGEILADAADIATLLATDYARFVVPAFVHQGEPLLVGETSELTDEAGRAITR